MERQLQSCIQEKIPKGLIDLGGFEDESGGDIWELLTNIFGGILVLFLTSFFVFFRAGVLPSRSDIWNVVGSVGFAILALAYIAYVLVRWFRRGLPKALRPS